ncbi:hypothetical protein ACHAXS_007565 [Conticribra weissflogii]
MKTAKVSMLVFRKSTWLNNSKPIKSQFTYDIRENNTPHLPIQLTRILEGWRKFISNLSTSVSSQRNPSGAYFVLHPCMNSR